MLGWFKSSSGDSNVQPGMGTTGMDGVSLLNSFYVSGIRAVIQMNKLVYAVEKLIKKTDRQNVTTQCSKCFYLFCNSTNINRALNKCQGWSKGMLRVLWAICKDQKNFPEQAAAVQGFGVIFQGLHQIR